MNDRRHNHRPNRLPPASTLVVWGSRKLTLAQKVVWYHDWLMDYRQTADGSYMGAKSMSNRLGGDVSLRTVEQIRWQLNRWGLYHTFKRAGCRESGRVCTLPDGCITDDNKEAPALAAILDRHLGSMGIEPVVQPGMNPNGDSVQRGMNRPSASSISGEGGKGGVTPVSPLGETQLPSVVKSLEENGEVAIATEKEWRRRNGESTQAWITRLGGRHG